MRAIKNKDQEIWLPIEGYENLYLISNHGRIFSLPGFVCSKKGRKRFLHGRILNLSINQETKAVQVTLYKDGVTKMFQVHRLVASAFIPKKRGRDIVNHIDANRSNNKASNLEWCTQQENVLHSLHVLKRPPNHRRPIIQFDLNKEIIAEHESVCAAARAINKNAGCIYKAANTQKYTYLGFIWKFKDELETETLHDHNDKKLYNQY